MTGTWEAGEAIDDAAAKAFFAEFGDQAEQIVRLVAIVIAAYNEQGMIGSVVDALPASICGLATTTVVVSDGSADRTVTEGREHGALVADVPVNRGQGAALRLGYRLAREGGARYIVTTDADGQYNPAEMERVLAPVVAGDADFVTGSRKLGSQETKDLVRRMGTWVFATTISVLTGTHITDSSFGLRAMRSEVTGVVRLEQPQYQSAELLIAVLARGFRSPRCRPRSTSARSARARRATTRSTASGTPVWSPAPGGGSGGTGPRACPPCRPGPRSRPPTARHR